MEAMEQGAQRQEAERQRLLKALEDGPRRRMEADAARGMELERGDVWQARAYEGWIGATKKARSDSL